MNRLTKMITCAAAAAVMTVSSTAALSVSADWVKTSGGYAYTNEQGENLSGWNEIDGGKYYFGKDGYAISCTITEDGYIYEFDCDEGLVSKTEIVTDYSDIKIKVGSFVNPDTSLYGFKAKNNEKGSCMTYSGWLKVPYSTYRTVSVYAELLNKDGDIIDEICMVRRAKINLSGAYHIDSYVYTSEPVYEIKFSSIIVK